MIENRKEEHIRIAEQKEVTSLPPSAGIMGFRRKWLSLQLENSEKINKEEELLPEGQVDQR